LIVELIDYSRLIVVNSSKSNLKLFHVHIHTHNISIISSFQINHSLFSFYFFTHSNLMEHSNCGILRMES
jgi:hypothetical protein